MSDALRDRGPRPLLICHIGLGTEEDLRRVRLRKHDRVVDLDQRSVGDGVVEGGLEDGLTQAAVERVVLVAATPTDLRRAVPAVAGLAGSARFVFVVKGSAAHVPPPFPVVPGMGQWAGVVDSRLRRILESGWLVELSFVDPVPLPGVVASLSYGLAGARRGSAIAPLTRLYGMDSGLWRPGDVRGNGTRHVDAVLDTRVDGGPGAEGEGPAHRVRRWSLADSGWSALGRPKAPLFPQGGFSVDDVPPLDESVVNPIGFVHRTKPDVGRLVSRGGRWVLMAGDEVRVRVPEDGTVTDVDIEAVRDLRGVRVKWGRHSGPLAAVRAIAGLAAAGVPLVGERAPVWAACLGEELNSLLASVRTGDLKDGLRREEHSIRLRRAALRTHGAQARWRGVGLETGVDLPSGPTVSVVMCTRRPEMVAFALRQISRQRGVNPEIVLALHGFGMEQDQVRGAVVSYRAKGGSLVVYEADPGLALGSVLNRAVLRAGGDLIVKMDDDDWYGPEHLADLLMARAYSGADVVGSAAEFVYLEALDITVRLPLGENERVSRRISGGTLMMDRLIWEETGGFRPVPTSEDTQFLTGVSALGGRVYRTHGCNYVLRRKSGGHTWSVGSGYFLKGASSRQLTGWRPSELLEPDPADRPPTGQRAAGAPSTTVGGVVR